MGARPDGPGAGRMGDHRHRDLRAHVPLAAGRGMTSPSLVRTALASPHRGEDGPPLSERGWHVTQVVLHVVFAVFVGLAVLDAVIEEDGGRQAVLIVALAVLALVYVAVGAPALDARNHRLLAVYLLVLVAVVAVLAWV